MTWLIALVGLVLGVVAGLGLMIVEFGAWFLISTRQPVPSEADADPLVSSAEPIRARAADGLDLAGLWLPALRPSSKIIILVHGFMDGSTAMIADRAEALLARGWSVAAIDQRGQGSSSGVVSGFAALKSADLSVWLDVLADRFSGEEPRVVVVWGRSMGAMVALRAAAGDPRIRALVLEAPLVDLEAVIATRLRIRRIPLASFLARLMTERAGRLAGVSVRLPKTIDLARRLAIPAVVIHGREDALVLASTARELADAFSPPAAYLEVAGAGHVDVAAVGGPPLLDGVLASLDDGLEFLEARAVE